MQLTISKGQVNVKVNIISAMREPLGLSIIIHSATTVHQLRQLICEKMPDELRQLGQCQIILSHKKKQLEDNKYLFETLYEVFNMQEDDEELPNQRMNNANLQRASQVDAELLQYSR